MELLAPSVSITGTVADGRHTPYLPAVLPLEDVRADGKARLPIEVVIYDGAQRGEYLKGDRVWVKGRLVKVARGGRAHEAALVTKPEEIGKR